MNLTLAEKDNATAYTPATYPSLAKEDAVDVLRLIRSENVGPITFFHVLALYGNVQSALENIPYMSLKGGRKKPITLCSREQAEKEMEAATAFGARMLKYGEKDYPALLCSIYDPPPMIAAIGNPTLYNGRPTVGMVGARNASANGCQFAYSIAAGLGKKEVTIISGLARGIDSAAHKGSLATGTVAVIAGGIDTIYPPENATLYKNIAAQGAIISEQPFGNAPHAASFPGRNRIISSMAKAAVIVEASLKSGSLITARYAAEQGREVFAVPGSPMDPRCKGTNMLLRQGASFCESAEDVWQTLSHPRRIPLAESKPASYLPPPTRNYDENETAEARALVQQKLGYEPVLVDELIIQCQYPASLLHTVLLELELAGNILRHPGGRVSLIYKDA